jgi:hypothetical protein
MKRTVDSQISFGCLQFFQTDNEVDGMAFLHLTDTDVASMFPGKIGVSRKLMALLNKLRHQSSQPVRLQLNTLHEVF